MFKKSALKPQAEPGACPNGSRGHQKRVQQPGEGGGDDASPASCIQDRGYASQAAGITRELEDVSKYKSLALFAEVKLSEALEACAKACPDVHEADGALIPNKLRTAVCCQLLGEFAAFCSPFANVLTILRDQLLPAIYSDMFAPEAAAGPLAFDQLPWFSVAARQRAQNDALVEQRECIRGQLVQQGKQVDAVEQQLLSFHGAMNRAEEVADALRASLAAAQAAQAAASGEASTWRHEAARLGAEVEGAKQDAAEAIKALAAAKEGAASEAEAFAERTARMQHAMAASAAEAAAAVEMAAVRVAPEEMSATQAALAEAEEQLWDARRQLAAQETALAELNRGELTPRPDWSRCPSAASKGSSSSRVRFNALLAQHASATTALTAQLEAASAWAAPDSAPAAWQLSISVASSKYFLTELDNSCLEGEGNAATPAKDAGSTAGGSDGADAADGGGRSSSAGSAGRGGCHRSSGCVAAPMGHGPDVPRLLRWAGQPLELQAWELVQLEQQLAAVWKAKAVHETTIGPSALHTLLHQHMQQRQQQQEGGSQQGVTQQQALAWACYSLYYAVCQHRHASAHVRLFWSVLTGQLPEAAHADQQAMLSGFAQVMAALAPQGQLVPLADAAAALRVFLPARQPHQLAALVDALEACCIPSDEHTSGSQQLLSAEVLVAAMREAAGGGALEAAAHSSLHAQVQGGGIAVAQAAAFVSLLAAQHLEELEAVSDATLHRAWQVLQAAMPATPGRGGGALSARTTARSALQGSGVWRSLDGAGEQSDTVLGAVEVQEEKAAAQESTVRVPWDELAAALLGRSVKEARASSGRGGAAGQHAFTASSALGRLAAASAADQPLVAGRRSSAAADCADLQQGSVGAALAALRLQASWAGGLEQVLAALRRSCLLASSSYSTRTAVQWASAHAKQQ